MSLVPVVFRFCFYIIFVFIIRSLLLDNRLYLYTLKHLKSKLNINSFSIKRNKIQLTFLDYLLHFEEHFLFFSHNINFKFIIMTDPFIIIIYLYIIMLFIICTDSLSILYLLSFYSFRICIYFIIILNKRFNFSYNNNDNIIDFWLLMS